MPKIPIRCKGNRYLPYNQLKTFQGSLKELTKDNAEKLKRSILKFGWITPVFVWKKNCILDGHGRLLILSTLLNEGYTVDDLPVVDIQAKTKKEAAEILLAINSHYQTITDEGLYEFMHDMNIDFEEFENFELADIDIEGFKGAYFGDFAPVGEEEQGKLDEKSKIKCPNCGHEFTP
jgi:hypothetical protein